MTIIPKGYESRLSLYDTQRAVERIKYIFLAKLCTALHLVRVTAPLVVDPTTGMNDNLSGVERPVSFDVLATGKNARVLARRQHVKAHGALDAAEIVIHARGWIHDEGCRHAHEVKRRAELCEEDVLDALYGALGVIE